MCQHRQALQAVMVKSSCVRPLVACHVSTLSSSFASHECDNTGVYTCKALWGMYIYGLKPTGNHKRTAAPLSVVVAADNIKFNIPYISM